MFVAGCIDWKSRDSSDGDPWQVAFDTQILSGIYHSNSYPFFR